MSWPTSVLHYSAALPNHCEPTNEFLSFFSRTFQTCVPTPLAFISNTLGILSIVSWLFAQLPQIYKNWRISSTSGLSIFFLVEWCLGDLSNLFGALLTHQASWQVCIGAYYVFVDLCLVGQWIWYERLRHGNNVWKIWRRSNYGPNGRDDDASTLDGLDESPRTEGRPSTPEVAMKPRQPITFRTPEYSINREEWEKGSLSRSATPRSTKHYRIGGPSPMPSPSPRTMLLIVGLAAIARASPMPNTASPTLVTTAHTSTVLDRIGTLLSWASTVLYLLSRLPQILKNHQRKSTAGLSALLFAAAFAGNLFYSAAIATNPRAWKDFPPYGGNGWVGPDGSDRAAWMAAALPFFLGAAGVLGLDASVGVQFLIYGDGGSKVVVLEDGDSERRPSMSRWRRVSGWMRGWVPTSTVEEENRRPGKRRAGNDHPERDGLLRRPDERDYGSTINGSSH